MHVNEKGNVSVSDGTVQTHMEAVLK